MREVSPAKARPRTLYLLIFLNVVLAALLMVGMVQVNRIHTRLDESEDRSFAGCVRGNVLREVARFAMVELGSPERARLPEIQEQPCAELYPGGER